MRITYYGVRGSCPCSSDQYRRYGGNTSCVLVDVAGEPPLILDMGTGMRALGVDLRNGGPGGPAPLRANALLSHLHYDHVLGLPFFGPMHDPGSTLDVFGPRQQSGSLHDVLSAAVQPPFFPVGIVDFSGEVRFHDTDWPYQLELGSMTVTARRIPHLGDTLGYRIEAEGQVLAYVSDHQAPDGLERVDPEVAALCQGADLLIHDAQYTDEEFMTLPEWGHSTGGYAVHVARAAGVRRLHLFHHDPSHTDGMIDEMVKEANSRISTGDAPFEVEAAAEGASFVLGAERE